MEDWKNKIAETEKLVIVEGKKDKKALEDIGIKNIITISNSLTETLDKIDYREIIILTDLDQHGKKLYSIIKHNLQKKGKKIDNKFREFLFRETRITHIESIKANP